MLTRRSTPAGRWETLAGCGAFTGASLALRPWLFQRATDFRASEALFGGCEHSAVYARMACQNARRRKKTIAFCGRNEPHPPATGPSHCRKEWGDDRFG